MRRRKKCEERRYEKTEEKMRGRKGGGWIMKKEGDWEERTYEKRGKMTEKKKGGGL